MLSVKLWVFDKRRNSVDTPSADLDCRVYGATLKENTSVLNPRMVFKLESPFMLNDTAFNYAYIGKLNRYYYITNWTSEPGNIWVADMVVDALASWRNDILNSYVYLSRVSKTDTATNFPVLLDTVYPSHAKRFHSTTTGTSPFNKNTGCYVIGVVNGDNSGDFCGVSYYAMFAVEFQALCEYLYGDPSWANISDISGDLTKALFNPLQYIVSAIYYPVPITELLDLPDSGFLEQNLPLGWWSIPGIHYTKVDKRVYSLSGTINYDSHIQAGIKELNFLNYAPYSEHILEMPGFPAITLDNGLLFPDGSTSQHTPINYQIDIDIATGSALLKSEKFRGAYAGHVGVSVQLSQIRLNKPSMESILVSAGAGIISEFGNLVNGDLSAAATGVLSCVEQGNSSASTTGTTGTIIDLYRTPTVYSSFTQIVPYEPELFGVPFCQVRRIGAYSPGYVKAVKPVLNLPCLKPEHDEIVAALESGCYV